VKRAIEIRMDVLRHVAVFKAALVAASSAPEPRARLRAALRAANAWVRMGALHDSRYGSQLAKAVWEAGHGSGPVGEEPARWESLVASLTLFELFRCLDLKRVSPDLEERRQVDLPKLLRAAAAAAPGDLERLVADWTSLFFIVKPRGRDEREGPVVYASEGSDVARALTRFGLLSHAERLCVLTGATVPAGVIIQRRFRVLDDDPRAIRRITNRLRQIGLLPPQLSAAVPSLLRFLSLPSNEVMIRRDGDGRLMLA
jgi:hypothetical protein